MANLTLNYLAYESLLYRQMILSSLDMTGGIPERFRECTCYIEKSVVIPLAELVGVNMENLKQLWSEQGRLTFKDRAVEFIGPLKLTIPTSIGTQLLARSVVAIFAAIIAGNIVLSFIFSDEKDDNIKSAVAAIASVVLAGVGTFYWLGKTSLCQITVTPFPIGTTFVRGSLGWISPKRS